MSIQFKMLAAAGTIALLPLSAQAFTETFDNGGFNVGDAVDSLVFDGFSATVTTDSNRSIANGGTNQAGIFDTDNPTGNDNDLGPFFNPEQGNALIIFGPQEVNNNPNGNLPDDDRRGGTINFTFDNNEAFTLNSLTYIDFESSNNELNITGVDINDNVVDIALSLSVGNGQRAAFNTQSTLLKSVSFEFEGSGAIDDISISVIPLPAPFALLLAALGGFGFLGWRRTRAAA